MKKGLMVHYLPIVNIREEFTIIYEKYKEKIEEAHPEFKHIFFPTNGREGIEVLLYPEMELELTKEVL